MLNYFCCIFSKARAGCGKQTPAGPGSCGAVRAAGAPPSRTHPCPCQGSSIPCRAPPYRTHPCQPRTLRAPGVAGGAGGGLLKQNREVPVWIFNVGALAQSSSEMQNGRSGNFSLEESPAHGHKGARGEQPRPCPGPGVTRGAGAAGGTGWQCPAESRRAGAVPAAQSGLSWGSACG